MMLFLIKFAILMWPTSYVGSLNSEEVIQTVQWRFIYSTQEDSTVFITFEAKLEAGWHIYSQFLEEGGPMPTRFKFDRQESIVLIGATEERGELTRFVDDIYEMEIGWYSGTVSFIQKIKLLEPIQAISGSIEYMTCDNHLCVPQEEAFNIDLRK